VAATVRASGSSDKSASAAVIGKREEFLAARFIGPPANQLRTSIQTTGE